MIVQNKFIFFIVFSHRIQIQTEQGTLGTIEGAMNPWCRRFVIRRAHQQQVQYYNEVWHTLMNDLIMAIRNWSTLINDN